MAAVGKLAVEAGEQRRVLIEREPRASIDLQRVAPGARAVDSERRTWHGLKRAGDRAVRPELVHPCCSHERRPHGPRPRTEFPSPDGGSAAPILRGFAF